MKHRIAALAVAAALAACSRSEYSAGDVDSAKDTTHTTIDIGMKTDTINIPTLGIEKDTIVVSKPVVGRKPVEVSHPTVTKKP
jgi:hypothetical protein